MTGVRKVTENIVERFSETSENEIMIKIDNVKKQYRLGTIGGGTLRGDLQSWWAKVRGKEDPNSKIGAKVYKKNEKFMALDGITLEVKKGERLGIIGHNGAGKSTLLNAMEPSLQLPVGEISEKLGRGRHTTRQVQLYPCAGGYLADTPGFSTFEVEQYPQIDKNC